MRLLLDENLPKRLKIDFPEHEIYTVREKGWQGLKNGELLQQLLDNEFDCLLTFDKNLKHQQNFQKYTIAVFALSAETNTYEDLTKLSPTIKEYLKKRSLPKGVIAISRD
jgi:predicted nuclease of predicted toxin-antitoxin system